MKNKTVGNMVMLMLLVIGCKTTIEDYIQLEKGNWWEFSATVEELGIITSNTYIYREVSEELESARYGTLHETTSISEDDGIPFSGYEMVTNTRYTMYLTEDSRVEQVLLQEPLQEGNTWRSVWYKNEDFIAEYEIIELNASVTVPAGSFTGCLVTHCKYEDDLDLEIPGDETLEQDRWYAPGIGLVKKISIVESSNGNVIKETTLLLEEYGIQE